MSIIPEDVVDDFVDYCRAFYGFGGTYAMDAPEPVIRAAVAKYLSRPLDEWDFPFEGDSMDREQVRGILEHNFGMHEK
jgi:hypothetical protein